MVWGDISQGGSIKKYVGRSPKNRKVMTTFEDSSQGKLAITHYRPIKRFGYVTLVECQLETGRTHQIRVHMQSIGHPLFNDIEYGGDKIKNGPNTHIFKTFIQKAFEFIPGQALHAKTLGFVHPKNGDELHFDSEINSGFEALLAHIENSAFGY